MTTSNNLPKVQQVILDYLEKYHRADTSREDILDEPFTGQVLKMSGSDLYRMLMWLEDVFEIYIMPDLIRREGFETVRQAAAMFTMLLEVKNEEDSHAQSSCIASNH